MHESTSKCAVCGAETSSERVCASCNALAGPQSIIQNRSWETWQPPKSTQTNQLTTKTSGVSSSSVTEGSFTPPAPPTMLQRLNPFKKLNSKVD